MRFQPRALYIPLGVVAMAAAMSVPAFAQVEEEIVSGPKTRDQVVAELEQSRLDGSLAKVHSEEGYQPDFDEAKGEDVSYSNTQPEADFSLTSDSSVEMQFSPPAAGGKSRAQVLDELQQAREDGTLDRTWSDSGYAPEFEAPKQPRP